MTRRLTGFVLASLMLLASASAYAREGRCELNCFCYMAEEREGRCGTISESGCAVVNCIHE